MTNRVLVSINHKSENEGYPNVIVANQDELVEHIQEALPKGVIKFAFLKTDGTVREAYGTTNPQLIAGKDYEHLKKGFDKLFESLRDIIVAIQTDTLIISEVENAALLLDQMKSEEKQKSEKKQNDALIAYFDVQIGQFRSFAKDRLVTVYL